MITGRRLIANANRLDQMTGGVMTRGGVLRIIAVSSIAMVGVCYMDYLRLGN